MVSKWQGKYAISIFEDKEFDKATKCLQAVRKQRKKNQAKNVKNTKAAKELADKGVNILYEKQLGFRRGYKVFSQHNLTKFIFLLSEKVNKFYQNVEGENLSRYELNKL